MQPIIREATEADAEALRAYATALFAEDLPGIFRRAAPTLDDELAYIKAGTEPANSTVLLAQIDGALAGMVHLAGESLAEEAHAATFGISVHKDWRGRGVGGQLLDAMLDWAARHRITRVQGFVWDNNPGALALYERHGFVREGLLRQAVMRDGSAIDVIVVAKLLDD